MRIFAFTFLLALTPNVGSAWNTPTAVTSLGNNKTGWTWTGAVSADWNNGGNWCGTFLNGSCSGQGGPPPATAMVVFDDSCTVNCNPTLPATISIASLNIKSNYSGTISQGATNITIGSGGYSQAGGTFIGGTGTINLTSANPQPDFRMTGGTFTGGSGNITSGGGPTLTGGSFLVTGGNFTSTSGTLKIISAIVEFSGLTSFSANGGTIWFAVPSNFMTLTIDNSGYIFNNIKIDASNGRVFNLAATTLTMDGNLVMDVTSTGTASFNNGTINLRQGNVTRTGYNAPGSLLVRFSGSVMQTLDSSGVVAGYTEFPGISALHPGPAGSLKFIGNIALTGGFLTAANMGTIDLNGALITFSGNGATSAVWDTANFISFPDLRITGNPIRHTFGLVKVAGNVIISTVGGTFGSNAGIVEVGGDLILSGASAGFMHVATFKLNGVGNQLLDIVGTARVLPSIEINKPGGGTVSANATPIFFGNFNYVAGGFTVPTTVQFGVGTSTLNTTVTSNGIVFNNVEWGRVSLSANYWTAVDPLKVSGDFTFKNANASTTRLQGTVEVAGNIVAMAQASGFIWFDTTSLIRLTGSGQTIDFSASTASPGTQGVTKLATLEIASIGGTTTFIGSISMNALTYVSGTVDAIPSSVVFTTSNSTITPGPVEFDNVSFIGITTTIAASPMIVKGLLSFATPTTGRSMFGSFDAYGDVTFTSQSFIGTASIRLLGNNTTLTRSSVNLPSGTITVSKNAGQGVTLLSNLALNANQNINVTSGSIDIGSASNTLTVSGTGTLTLAATTTVKLSGGTLSVGGSNIGAGAYSGGNVVP